MRNDLIIAVAALIGVAILYFTREPEQPDGHGGRPGTERGRKRL
jgi:hypothetical protein